MSVEHCIYKAAAMYGLVKRKENVHILSWENHLQKRGC